MTSWTFDLSSRGFDPDESQVYADDLAAIGADASMLTVWSATLAARSSRTRPLLLRVSSRGRPVGAA